MDLRPPPARPGWYADPVHRHETRWWSGEAWTEHVADLGKRTVDPIAPKLSEANAAGDWIERRSWRDWGRPANAVRGESYRQDAFLAIPGVDPELLDDRFQPVAVRFTREPDNLYDRNACKATVSGQHVGYLSRECAARLAPEVDAARVASWDVAGAIVGGLRGAENFGVHVWLDRRLSAGPAWPR